MTFTGPAIQVQDLVKIYRGTGGKPVRALDGLSLEVRQGEIFGLLGKNGAGKTTLLRILTTLIPPTSGSARVMGMDVQARGLDIRRSICAVLQENAVEIFLSVDDNLATYARFQGVPRAEARRRADRALEVFGLTEYRSQKVIDLSGGLKRRVQVAKVFMADKPIVFLDEATTGMDPLNKRATLDAIREEAVRGRTILLTTHILQEAEDLCNTIAIIDRGRTVAQGDLRAITALTSRAFDMSITFGAITDATLTTIRAFPLRKMTVQGNTVDLVVHGQEASALGILQALSADHAITHFEVSGASLEDVFVELLTRDGTPGGGDAGGENASGEHEGGDGGIGTAAGGRPGRNDDTGTRP
jgi:ABC-2 type transport system ATP-binding protein